MKSDNSGEVQIVSVKPAPWEHIISLGREFGPEDVKVFVRDERIRVEGRKELSVSGNDDIIECLDVSREIIPPCDVILDDLTVFFNHGGVLRLEAPRRPVDSIAQPALEKHMQKMSVDDIEADADDQEAKIQGHVEDIETMKELERQKEEVDEEQKTTAEHVENNESTKEVERQREKEKEVEIDDWETVSEEEAMQNNQQHEEKDWVKDTEREDGEENENDKKAAEEQDEEVAKSDQKENSEEETSIKFSEIEEVATKSQEQNSSNQEVRLRSENIVIRIVSEEQQEKQMEENTVVTVMNLTGFELRDISVVTSECGDKIAVRAVKETEEDGFHTKKESFRSFPFPENVRAEEIACTMGPEARFVVTAAKN